MLDDEPRSAVVRVAHRPHADATAEFESKYKLPRALFVLQIFELLYKSNRRWKCISCVAESPEFMQIPSQYFESKRLRRPEF